jgi:hypothetical protein
MMKKMMLIVLGMILVLGIASVANAASFANVALRATISNSVSVSVSTGLYVFPAMATNTKAVSTAVTVTNDSGAYVETYYFKGFNAGVWTLGAAQGANTYTLAAAFHGSAPGTAAFVAEDQLKNGSWDNANGDTCTASKFSIDGTQTGVAVSPTAGSNTRSLWFCLGTPTSTTTTGPLDLTVTITAGL